jgi:hypothetical protein
MRLDVSPEDLRPIVSVVAEELAARMAPINSAPLALSYREAKAAEMLGIDRHVLRDCRLRGEIKGAKIGKATCYTVEELRAFLARKSKL